MCEEESCDKGFSGAREPSEGSTLFRHPPRTMQQRFDGFSERFQKDNGTFHSLCVEG